MATSVLPQLLDVNSELSAQATALEAQLAELQEKRKGIQTVIAMFESGGGLDLDAITAATGSATKKTAAKKTTKTATKRKTTGKRGRPAKATTAAKATKSTKATKAKAAKSTAKPATKRVAKSTTKKSAAKSADSTVATPKRSGRTANWQRYVQENYSKSPLPDVIVGVLQAQPNNVFKIADVMSAVFKEDMPKNHFLKARNRISNILSAGARDGVWHRGRGGTYSMSEKSIKAS